MPASAHAPERPAFARALPRAVLFSALLAALAGAHAVPAAAQAVNRNGTPHAIAGYDAVAYHTEGRAVRGDGAHTHRWRGALWLFATDANRAAFAASPERYAPAYGGYCAYAMARGDAVRIDPSAFTLVNGRLYLNYDAATRTRWAADRDRYIREANARWPEVRARLERPRDPG